MCRQLGCEEQQDILRPYSTINYAWDEPSLPHKLVLSLPGNRVLGIFELDKVHNPPTSPMIQRPQLACQGQGELQLTLCWVS